MLEAVQRIIHEKILGPVDPKGKFKVHLYDMRECVRLRNENVQRLPGSNENWTLKKWPAVQMDLSYLITVDTEDALEEHQLLGEGLRQLFRHQFIPNEALPLELKQDGGNGGLLFSVAQLDHQSHRNPEQLFLALQMKLRPAIWLTATVGLDVFEPQHVRVVRHALLGLGLLQPDGTTKVQSLSGSQVSVTGVVRDQNGPLAGAEILLQGTNLTAKTDKEGVFFFVDIPPQKVTLEISKSGYVAATRETTCPPPGRVDLVQSLDIQLTPDGSGISESIDTPPQMRALTQITKSYSGVLYFEDGSPAQSVVLKCKDRVAVTNASGEFVFNGVPYDYPHPVAEITGRGEVAIVFEAGRAIVKA